MFIITGVSGGLGEYLVRTLRQDSSIIGTYYNNKPVAVYPNVTYCHVDVKDSQSISAFTQQVSDKLDKITLVNLAGVSLDGMGHKMKESFWDTVIDVNLKGTFLMCKSLLPYMREQKWGRIINIASVVGQVGIPGTVAYSSSKAGVTGLTRTLAVENAPMNITVNTLALGYFNTGMINEIKPEIQELLKRTIPMRQLGHPKNLISAIRFLVDSDYTTGSIININGGLYA
jgi:NAD(P)-dependent dehydrogenase (short-subunit alcohol dehydrogenase family)